MFESILLLVMCPALLFIVYWTIQNDKPGARHKTKGLLALKDTLAETDAPANDDNAPPLDGAKP